MSLTYLMLIATGGGIIWFGLKTREEVYRIAAAIAGAVMLIWGFALTPLPFQLLIEILMVGAVFSICIRCTSS